MAKRITKEEQENQLCWSACVEIFFAFYKQNFSGEKPSFDGSAPRDLKNIVLALKKRAEEREVEWTEEVAKDRLLKFLEYAYSDAWVRDNFMLHILNRKKDAIFVKIAQERKPSSVQGLNKGYNSGHVSGQGGY